jgi:hypothetical protein
VPGHIVINGNEIADELARQGSLQPCVGHEPTFGISAQIAREVIREAKGFLRRPSAKRVGE